MLNYLALLYIFVPNLQFCVLDLLCICCNKWGADFLCHKIKLCVVDLIYVD